VIVEARPEYVPPTERSETHLLFLVSGRTRARLGIGSELVRHAAAEARGAGSEVLRVHCWTGAPHQIRRYVRSG
jgi:ribosomal protein S18 acetylase RimI-like enzyme